MYPTGATNGYGIVTKPAVTVTTGTVTNLIGLMIDWTSITGTVTNAISLYVNPPAVTGANYFAVYVPTGVSYLGGSLGIGVAVPAAALSVGAGSLFRVTSAGIISQAAGITSSGSIYFTGLTQGSVPFLGASGLISQDNATLYWDNTNKRLGVGTNSPSTALHLGSGSIQIVSTKIADSAGCYYA